MAMLMIRSRRLQRRQSALRSRIDRLLPLLSLRAVSCRVGRPGNEPEPRAPPLVDPVMMADLSERLRFVVVMGRLLNRGVARLCDWREAWANAEIYSIPCLPLIGLRDGWSSAFAGL
jgi:hypothetical protein